jgi:hypothetical protein
MPVGNTDRVVLPGIGLAATIAMLFLTCVRAAVRVC